MNKKVLAFIMMCTLLFTTAITTGAAVAGEYYILYNNIDATITGTTDNMNWTQAGNGIKSTQVKQIKVNNPAEPVWTSYDYTINNVPKQQTYKFYGATSLYNGGTWASGYSIEINGTPLNLAGTVNLGNVVGGDLVRYQYPDITLNAGVNTIVFKSNTIITPNQNSYIMWQMDYLELVTTDPVVGIENLEIQNSMGQSLPKLANNSGPAYSGENAVRASVTIKNNGTSPLDRYIVLSYSEGSTLKNSISQLVTVPANTTQSYSTQYLLINRTANLPLKDCKLTAYVSDTEGGADKEATVTAPGQYNIKEEMTSFIGSTTAYNETVMMVGAPAQAKLLFTPTKILSVTNFERTKEYSEGVDWVYENGYLKLLTGTSAFSYTTEQAYPSVSSDQTFGKKGGGFIVFGNDNLYTRQLSVTYTHKPVNWEGPVYKYSDNKLLGTKAKLNGGSEIKIALLGDSISAGNCASGRYGVSPYTPNWIELFKRTLENNYRSNLVTLESSDSGNLYAKGGTVSSYGVGKSNELKTQNADLVIIAFGMNDASGGVSKASYKANIEAMINNVKSTNQNAEFVLVASMVSNPESTITANDDLFNQYREALNELAYGDTKIQVLNMTDISKEILKNKKFLDMTGNNVNHPNDYLVRWYAQALSSMLVN